LIEVDFDLFVVDIPELINYILFHIPDDYHNLLRFASHMFPGRNYSGGEGLGFRRERWTHIDGWKIGSFIRSAVVCTCPNPITAGPNRPYGRIEKTVAPALLDFLNP
jgi:hypothetical protein